MMRGYSGSSGTLRVYDRDLLALGNDSASDLDDIIAFMRKRPEVDGSRIVVAGENLGGWNSLALGARHPAGVKGVVS